MHALPLRNLTRYFLFRRNESPPPPRISRKWNVFVFFLKFWHDSNFWISVVTLLTDKKINNNRFLLSNSKSSFPPATLERSFRETSTYQHPGLLITDTHTLSLSLSLSFRAGRSRSTTESTLYLLLRFRSRVPFTLLAHRGWLLAVAADTGATETTKEQFFPLRPAALSPLFIYRSFVERDDRDDRGDRARIPPSSNEAKELRSTIRGQDDPRGSGWPLQGDLSPRFRCRFHTLAVGPRLLRYNASLCEREEERARGRRRRRRRKERNTHGRQRLNERTG